MSLREALRIELSEQVLERHPNQCLGGFASVAPGEQRAAAAGPSAKRTTAATEATAAPVIQRTNSRSQRFQPKCVRAPRRRVIETSNRLRPSSGGQPHPGSQSTSVARLTPSALPRSEKA